MLHDFGVDGETGVVDELFLGFFAGPCSSSSKMAAGSCACFWAFCRLAFLFFFCKKRYLKNEEKNSYTLRNGVSLPFHFLIHFEKVLR